MIAGVLEQSWEPTNIYLSIKEAHLLPQMAAHIDKIISDFWSDPSFVILLCDYFAAIDNMISDI